MILANVFPVLVMVTATSAVASQLGFVDGRTVTQHADRGRELALASLTEP